MPVQASSSATSTSGLTIGGIGNRMDSSSGLSTPVIISLIAGAVLLVAVFIWKGK